MSNKNLPNAIFTKDGRPAGTPRYNNFEIQLTQARHQFVLYFEPEFYENKVILDIGCGYGSGTRYMQQKKAKHVTGIDFNPEAISLAKEKFSDENIEFITKDILLYNSSKKFDIITATELVEHITDLELKKLLAKIHHLLNDNGFLYITTPERRLPKNEFPKGSHWTEYDYLELVNIIESNNFTLVWGIRKWVTDGISMGMVFKKNGQ